MRCRGRCCAGVAIGRPARSTIPEFYLSFDGKKDPTVRQLLRRNLPQVAIKTADVGGMRANVLRFRSISLRILDGNLDVLMPKNNRG